MPIETHVDHARTRVAAERETAAAKRDAIAAFRERLAAMEPSAGVAQPRTTTDGGVRTLSGATSRDDCGTVRAAFAETIGPHSDVEEDAPLLEAVRTEFTASIAAALAPNDAATLTPQFLRAIDAEAETRRRETELLLDVLDREAAALDDAASVVDEITGWLVRADETPLSDLGFDELAARHDRLARHRECYTALAAERQSFVEGVTSDDGVLALTHSELLSNLYEDFPVEYPVLSTVARLEETCADCQRVVRDHLVRCV